MRRAHLGGTLLAIGLLTACTTSPESTVEQELPEPTSAPTALTTEGVEQDLDLALSTPVEDSVYPQVGDPGVDALLYDLDLTWLPEQRMLEGQTTLTFRATGDAQRFQVDLARPLEGLGRDPRR